MQKYFPSVSVQLLLFFTVHSAILLSFSCITACLRYRSYKYLRSVRYTFRHMYMMRLDEVNSLVRPG